MGTDIVVQYNETADIIALVLRRCLNSTRTEWDISSIRPLVLRRGDNTTQWIIVVKDNSDWDFIVDCNEYLEGDSNRFTIHTHLSSIPRRIRRISQQLINYSASLSIYTIIL